jgi:hypothetical protein
VPKPILLEEFRLTVFARPGLGDEKYTAMHRTLGKSRLDTELRCCAGGYPSLRETR